MASLSTIEECRNELADIRHDAVMPLLRALVATNNGYPMPEDVKTDLQGLAERDISARIALAQVRNEIAGEQVVEIPTRPAYYDPA